MIFFQFNRSNYVLKHCLLFLNHTIRCTSIYIIIKIFITPYMINKIMNILLHFKKIEMLYKTNKNIHSLSPD